MLVLFVLVFLLGFCRLGVSLLCTRRRRRRSREVQGKEVKWR
jgi:hypothetical protein